MITDESVSPSFSSGTNTRISKAGIHLNKAIKKKNNLDNVNINEKEIPLRKAIKKEIICDSGSISEEEIIQENSIKKEDNQINIDESNSRNVLSKRHVEMKSPYECGVCSKIFKIKRDFERHWMTHSGEKPYECELCQISFSRPDKYAEHKKTRKHQQKERGNWIDFEANMRVTSSGRYQCVRCLKKIHSLRNFKRHFMKHVGIRPFKCLSCKSAFVCKTDLVAHQKRHSDKRNI